MKTFVSKKATINTLITIPSILALAACGGGGGGGGANPLPGTINNPPTISGTPATSVNENSAYGFTPTANDVDASNTLTFNITNRPSWASFDGATGALTGTPLDADAGITTSGIVISVTDNIPGSAPVLLPSFNITVNDINNVPTISGIPATSVNEDSPYSFTPIANDLDAADTLVFSITNVPSWASFDAATGALTGTPSDADAGIVTAGIEISVTDGNSAPVSLPSFDIVVNNINDIPTILGSPATSVNEDSAYSFTPIANDVDAGDVLTFSITNIPSWASFSTTTGALTGTPQNADAGITTSGIEISVTDGNSAPVSLPSFGITVNNINDAPVISGTPQMSTISGGMFDFTPSVSDVDVGDTMTFGVAGAPAWLSSFNTSTGQVSGTPGIGDVGTSSVTITVTDSGAATDTLTFDVVVENKFNEALYAEVSPSQTISLESMYQVADGVDSNGWVSTDAVPFMDFALDVAAELHRVDLRDLAAIGDQVTDAVISFSNDGSPIGSDIVTGALTDDGTAVSFAISPPVVADNVRVTLTSTASTTRGLAEVEIYSALAPGQAENVAGRDLFNVDSIGSFRTVEECDFVGSSADRSNWSQLSTANSAGINNVLLQTGRCRGISVVDNPSSGSAIEGTYLVQDAFSNASGEFDIRLRVRSEAGDVSAPDNGNDGTGIGTDPFLRGVIGIMFNYTDANNYYRYQVSQRDGHQKIMKKSGGVYTQLAKSTESYPLGEWVNLRVVRQNGVIIVFQDGQQVLAAADSDQNGTQLALFCSKNRSCFYDNLIVLDAPSTPIVALSSPAASFVDADGTLDVSAVVSDVTSVGGVEFVVDEGTGSEVSLVTSAPFTGSFSLGSVAGNHSVRAYALASDGVTRLSDTNAMDESAQVGVNGIVLLTVGDSITEGLRDGDRADDTSLVGVNAGRVNSGGFQSNLTDLLSEDNVGLPISLIVEANGNESTEPGSIRLPILFSRYPEVQAVLIQYGTNDHGGSSPVASGRGTVANVLVPSTYKDFVQIMINDANTAGVTAILSVPIQFAGDEDFVEGADYRVAIAELITENAGLANPPVQGPDFYQVYSLAADTTILLDDQIHPNNDGYIRMADEWCTTLGGLGVVGSVPLSCAP